MLRTTRARLIPAAVRMAARITDNHVTYTPHELNRLISHVAAHEVAGRLRERADWHTTRADDPGLLPLEREWHASEAVELEALAIREQARGGEHT
ncbi:hypothetical protein [Prauserella shujinwangii]|nr:hypothetical protein [Prauserella shujinwangii]